MALIKCVECGKEISDKASICPNCGCPSAETKQSVLIENIKVVITKTKDKISCLSRKQISIIGIVAIAFIIFLLIPNGVEKDKALLKEHLLRPDSLIIYEAYTNDTYGDGGRATLFYFGAENKRGGISDDWALVYDGNILFESNFNAAEDAGDNKGILENGEIVFAKFAVSIGNENWKKVNP